MVRGYIGTIGIMYGKRFQCHLANNIVFVVGTPAVSSVTVTPSTANLVAGQRLQLGVEVDTDYFAKQSVDWTVGNGDATVTY